LERKTLEESFTGRRPNVEHIRIFGCLTYSHVPSEKRTMLDPTKQQRQLCYLKLRAQQEVKDRPVGQPSSSSKIYKGGSFLYGILAIDGDVLVISWTEFF
jgi:hypothetical protein